MFTFKYVFKLGYTFINIYHHHTLKHNGIDGLEIDRMLR